jgi:hypothetical protein
MSLHAADLFLEYLMPETRLKFALAKRCGRDVHGLLTSAKDDLNCLLQISSSIITRDESAHKAFWESARHCSMEFPW